jgi:hypothetical protein
MVVISVSRNYGKPPPPAPSRGADLYYGFLMCMSRIIKSEKLPLSSERKYLARLGSVDGVILRFPFVPPVKQCRLIV